MNEEINAICQDCNAAFRYVLKPGYPRKYCPKCSAEHQAAFAAKQTPEDMQNPETFPVVKPFATAGLTPEQNARGLPMDNQTFKKAPVSAPNGQLPMYVSYAKDIFCAIIEKVPANMEVNDTKGAMTEATELVKQAMQELQ